MHFEIIQKSVVTVFSNTLKVNSHHLTYSPNEKHITNYIYGPFYSF